MKAKKHPLLSTLADTLIVLVQFRILKQPQTLLENAYRLIEVPETFVFLRYFGMNILNVQRTS